MLWLHVLVLVFARTVESYRHAEQFVFPIQDRSKLWHLLMYPQFGSWTIYGALNYEYYINNGLRHSILSLIVSLSFAWLAKHVFQKTFIKHLKECD